MEAHLVEDLDELRLAGKSSARRNGRVDLEVLLAGAWPRCEQRTKVITFRKGSMRARIAETSGLRG
jgi:hypothetical protein